MLPLMISSTLAPISSRRSRSFWSSASYSRLVCVRATVSTLGVNRNVRVTFP